MIDLANRLAGLLQDGQRLLLPRWMVQRIDAVQAGAERTPKPERSVPAAGRPPVAEPAELTGEKELVGHTSAA